MGLEPCDGAIPAARPVLEHRFELELVFPFVSLVTTVDRGRSIRANYGPNLMYYGGGHFDCFGH